MDIQFIAKLINDIGLSTVIASVFIYQSVKSIKKQEQIIVLLTKLEKQLNNDFLKGKGLEIALILKIQDIRWSIQKRIIGYIEKNHLLENWNIIIKEIDTFFEAKLINFETEMGDIVDKTTYKLIYDMLQKELENTKSVLVNILEELKNDGVQEKELYAKAVRIVEAHMQMIENEMISDVKKIFN